MNIPKGFQQKKGLEERTKRLTKGVKKSDIPEKITDLESATKYFANSIIPVYGYDIKKRIHVIDMPIRQVLKNNILLGKVNPLSKNPFKYKGVYFTKSLDMDNTKKDISLNFKIDITRQKPEYRLADESIQEIKKEVKGLKNWAWSLDVCNDAYFFTQDCTTVKVDTPKEILWVFETLKDFNPKIHGGALRDLYLGIERTADIDVQLKSPRGWREERRLRKFLKEVMDEVELVSKGWKEDSYHGGEYHPAHYHVRKDGLLYDIAGGVRDRFLSTEQIMMGNPGELMIYDLAKIDLDNKQFRLIESYNIPDRIFTKIKKLKGLGLTFLPENPKDLANNI